jgi:hypothetical protein
MITRYSKTVVQSSSEKVNQSAEDQAAAGKDDTCRCKEASKMTPRELLELMMGDLAFWKKEKKG